MQESSGRIWSLRPATLDDLPAVAAIESVNYAAPAVPWSQAAFEAELSKPYSTFWVMTDDETDSEIAGYIVFHHAVEDVWHLLNISVAEAFRRKGFAREMLMKLFSLACSKGAERIVLEVRKTNVSAVTLYQRAGFDIRQIHKRFYSNGDDAYAMALEVKEDTLYFP